MASASGCWVEQRFVGTRITAPPPLLPQLAPIRTSWFCLKFSLHFSLPRRCHRRFLRTPLCRPSPPSILFSHTSQLLHPQPSLRATCSIHTLIAVCWTGEGFALFSPNEEKRRWRCWWWEGWVGFAGCVRGRGGRGSPALHGDVM